MTVIKLWFKKTPTGALHADKLAELVIIYVFKMTFPAVRVGGYSTSRVEVPKLNIGPHKDTLKGHYHWFLSYLYFPPPPLHICLKTRVGLVCQPRSDSYFLAEGNPQGGSQMIGPIILLVA